MIINEAYLALGEEVSTIPEIDTAMKLGTNYPNGPFEWCDLIGAANVSALLEKLSQQNTRYTPAPLLKQKINEQ
jgi:3-hydroxybutyryl-CoA dehydrogenase